ncbi:MAG: 4-carboxymuconolactone decarboxylase [Rhodospirillaceae bacterium]|nr:4-carboxymuconolactone decarboxylase [Rhodospirillaceae bacterium]|tara:strand:- start:6117 stop:6485 length:369 start_codon:yes stop_codon:yes gene_type:complete
MSDDESRKRGEAITTDMWGQTPQGNEVSQEMIDITVEHLFGDIWSRPGLNLRDRSMITVATLVVTSKETQLKVHLKGALANGLSRDEIKEMMIHLAHYGGWPCAMTGLTVAKAVFDEIDGEA